MKVFRAISYVCTSLVLSGCASSCEPARRSALENEFRDEFGFKPTTDTTEIKCKSVHVGDSWSRWMRFTYDMKTLTNIIATGFEPVTEEMLKDSRHAVWEDDLKKPSSNAPNWWRIPAQVTGATYLKENPYSASNSMPSYCLIWVDKTQAVVYSESHAWQ